MVNDIYPVYANYEYIFSLPHHTDCVENRKNKYQNWEFLNL